MAKKKKIYRKPEPGLLSDGNLTPRMRATATEQAHLLIRIEAQREKSDQLKKKYGE